MMPSDAPWRSSPSSSAIRKRRSAVVAWANRVCSSSWRTAATPLPLAPARLSRARSRPAISSVGAGAAGPVAQRRSKAGPNADAALRQRTRQIVDGSCHFARFKPQQTGCQLGALGVAARRLRDRRRGDDEIGQLHGAPFNAVSLPSHCRHLCRTGGRQAQAQSSSSTFSDGRAITARVPRITTGRCISLGCSSNRATTASSLA